MTAIVPTKFIDTLWDRFYFLIVEIIVCHDSYFLKYISTHRNYIKLKSLAPKLYTYPRSSEGRGDEGVNWIHADVCPSVCLSLCSLYSFLPGIYPYGVSLLAPINFRVHIVNRGPLVAKYLVQNGISGTFWKQNKHWLNSCYTWHLHL